MSLNFSYWTVQTIAMLVTTWLIPRLKVTSFTGATSAVVCISLMNAFVWDADLFHFLPTAFTMKTFALLLINGVLFWIIVKILPGIEVHGVLPALLAPLVFTLCSLVAGEFARDVDWSEVFRGLFGLLQGLKETFQ